MSRTFISVRVSTREQSADGTSLPSQIRECLAFCRSSGLEMHPDSNVGSPGVFADPGVSAWKCPLLQRPGFLEIWNRAAPGDTVVFLSVDRGFRSIRDFLASMSLFDQKRLVPVFVRDGIRMDTAAGSLWACVRAAFAEYQSAILSERLKESYAIRRKRAVEQGESPPKQRKNERGEDSERKNGQVSDDIRRICEFRGLTAKKKEPGRIFRYVRVSTGEQNFEAQSEILTQKAEMYRLDGHVDVGEFVDHGVSAFYQSFRDRPAGREIWNQLRPGDIILVTRMDRIFRSTVDMGQTLREWDKIGVTFAASLNNFQTDTVGGRAMANLLCLMAQWESESISWRVRLAIQEIQQKQGPWFNSRLPNWVRRIPVKLSDGTTRNRLEVIPEEVRRLIQIRGMRENGMTYQEIGDALQTEHEGSNDMPIPVPRHGLENRWSIEQKLRRRGQFDDLKRFRTYCDRFHIGARDRIDRVYSSEDWSLFRLIDHLRDGGTFDQYMKVNKVEEFV